MPDQSFIAIQELRRLSKVKTAPPVEPAALGESMVEFFKRSVSRRQTKLAKLAEAWTMLVPEAISEHCALEGFSRGTLTVLVDNSSYLYELKQVLLAGLEEQLCLACRGAGLVKVMLKPGRAI
jgi:Dna[CI] antecedent DciA-like protein